MSRESAAGLSQADFRKLLQTPRVGSSNSNNNDSTTANSNSDGSINETQPQGQKQKAVLGGGRLHRAHNRREASSSEVASLFTQPKKPHGGSQKRHANKTNEEASTSKYRDRAAERRKGLNKDYEDSEKLLNQLQDGHSVIGTSAETSAVSGSTGMSVDKRTAYEQSKYLGGDTEHTHLVKGLDFLLLEKMRSKTADDLGDTQKKIDLDDELERLQQERTTSASSETKSKPELAITNHDIDGATSELGKRILTTLQHMYKAKEETEISLRDGFKADLNELFLPGRMYFEFNTAASAAAGRDVPVPTARIRNQDEIRKRFGLTAYSATYNSASDDSIVLSKVIASISAARNRRQQVKQDAKSQSRTGKHTTAISRHQQERVQEQTAETKKSEQANDDDGDGDDDDDIFADAGTDYEVTIAPKASIPENADDMDTAGPVAPTDAGYSEDEHNDQDEMVVGPYPAYDSEDSDNSDEGVTGAYPPSEPESEGDDGDGDGDAGGGEEGVLDQLPSRESLSGTKRRLKETDDYDYGIEFGQATINHNDLSGSDVDENDDMDLFSMAKSRFKAETRDLLQQQMRSTPYDNSHGDGKNENKRKLASKNEWHKTRKIMQTKYGIDIANDKQTSASEHKHKKSRS
ncbi:hypothetical protein GGI12_002530 [Dipsacomyces acuminosporus]|nr:hypothetical protein GGI12_002530 [Dipsacomyces acuminosporus]